MAALTTVNGCVAGVRLLLEDGTDLADKIDPRFLSLTLTEKNEGGADELQLTLHNADGLLATPSAGQMLRLAIGWVSGANIPLGLVDKGRFKVDEVEESGPPDIVTIRARSAGLDTDLTKRRTMMWEDTTLGEVLDEIAQRSGSTANVHPDLAEEEIDAIEQHNKSDSAFVQDLGKRFDALATWKDNRLVFMPKGSSTTASGQEIPPRVITKRDGWTWRFTRAERGTATGVEAQYHDESTGERKTVSEGGDDRQRLKHVYSSKAHAERAAKSNLAQRERGKCTFDYELAVADCSALPNQRVTLEGWSDTIGAVKWLIVSLETVIGPNGLKQRLQLEGA